MKSIKRSPKDQITSGLRLAGLVLLTFLTAVLLLWGALVVSSRVAGSVLMGWTALAAGFVILILNLRGCAKMLPGFLALAAFNALVMAASGHLLNDPSTPVPRAMATGCAIALAVGSVLSARLYGKHLSRLDRVVLVTYVGFILLGFVSQWLFISLTLGDLVLAVPWTLGRIRQRSARSRSRRADSSPAYPIRD